MAYAAVQTFILDWTRHRRAEENSAAQCCMLNDQYYQKGKTAM